MKAAVLDKYDKNGCELRIDEIATPLVGNDDVLIKVKYAGVNPLDNMIIRGEVKLITPYNLPLVLGNECSGIVEEVGCDVSEFKPGDRVYCRLPLDNIGAFAEFVSVDKNAVAMIPDYLDFDEAACVPLTALTAFQAFDLLNVRKGESVFISGGTGSFGAMAIPIAKSLGLNVITSGSKRNEDRVTKLGVDRFIDYKSEDYSEILDNVDYVIDTLGESELEKEFKILKRGGSLVSLKGMPNGEFASRMNMPLYKRLLFEFAGLKYDRLAGRNNQKYYFLFVESDGDQLERVSSIFDENRVDVSVDEVFDLDHVNDALGKVFNGGSKGKTLVRIC
ncbi:MAG: NADP-dependent oxidoreductase [Methanosphaera sp.]|nr:NADP-dependent oxidoreductase [Methanosphaera sp.]